MGDVVPQGDMLIVAARGPECPKCHEDGFDDWWHEKGLKSCGGTIRGRLKCHGCGRFFSVSHYADGTTYSTMRVAPHA